MAKASIPGYSRRYYLAFVVGNIEENCHLCQRGVTLDETFPGAPQAAHQLLSEAQGRLLERIARKPAIEFG